MYVKMEEELLWRAYRNSPTLFRTVRSPTPYGLQRIRGFFKCYALYKSTFYLLTLLPFLEIAVCIFLATPHLISGIGKSTGFKFGGYIYRANPNKSPLKI